jgi:hypothetical protein
VSGPELMSPADWEASWGIGAARSFPGPFLPLTRWERRTADLLCARGLDGYSAWLVTLANRFWWVESPWWWLARDLVWQVHREWAAAVEAGRD